MRNLKKVLALVLAMVMALSLMTVASAVSFEDQEDAKYQEAIQVLGALDVFKGYSEDKANFMPKQNITRAEAATIIYRIDTQDTGNKQDYLYVNNDFGDVPADHWAAGAIGYCVNKGIIKGYPDGTFKPGSNITGYEVLAMILREVGYDRNNEFQKNWPITVASTARHVGASTTLTSADSAALNQAATREVVAELLFRTMVNAEMVYPNALWSYRTTNDLNPGANVNNVKDITLGEDTFGLIPGKDTEDAWGRPGKEWLKGADVVWDSNQNINGVKGAKTHTGGSHLTTIDEEPKKEYYTAVTECDVAKDVGLSQPKAYKLWINGQTDIDANTNPDEYTIHPTNVKTKIGAQGRLTEVYSDRIVMIDTFLAKVTGKTDVKYDDAGHVRNKATITLDVYDGRTGDDAESQPAEAPLRGYTLTSSKDYSYAVGDWVLLYAYTNHVNHYNADTLLGVTDSSTVAVWDGNDRDTPAFNGCKIYDPNAKTYTVDPDTTSEANGNKEQLVEKYGEIVRKADTLTGSQTYIYWNTQQHEVAGKTYDDAAEFHHDEAKDDKDRTWTWFLDLYGNLIGNAMIGDNYSYGVITRMWWVNDTADGSGKALMNVQYINGETAKAVTLASMTVLGDADSATAYTDDTEAHGDAVYSTTTADADILMVNTTEEEFYVTTNYKENLDASQSYGYYSDTEHRGGNDAGLIQVDIIDNHLFRFTTDDEGRLHAVEVAGDGANNIEPYGALHSTGRENGIPIYGNTPNATVRVNDTTTFLIRTGSRNSNYKYSVVKGLNNMKNYEADEIDWVDADGNGIAECAYIIASEETASSEILFYYNDGRITYDINKELWTIEGYVNGEKGSITVLNDADYDGIPDAETNIINVIKANWLTSGRGEGVTVNNEEGTCIWKDDQETPKGKKSNLGNLYYLTLTDGVVDSATKLAGTTTGGGVIGLVDAFNGPVALDFQTAGKSDVYGDTLADGDRGYWAIYVPASKANSFWGGTFYDGTRLNPANFSEYRPNSDMKAPFGGFTEDIADMDVLMICYSPSDAASGTAGDLNVVQAYIVEKKGDEDSVQNTYSIQADPTVAVTDDTFGFTVKADIRQDHNAAGDAVDTPYNGKNKVTVTVTYKYFNAISGTATETLVKEGVKVSDLRGDGVTFYPVGVAAGTDIYVEATVYNDTIGELALDFGTGNDSVTIG